MSQQESRSRFQARLQQAKHAAAAPWGFVVLPGEASAKLPRRGRTSVEGRLNGTPFVALLEPDGNKSHWLRVDETLRKASGATYGEPVDCELQAVASEPEPDVPEDLAEALSASPVARETWQATTTRARLDWIHWIESAKQAKTRAKRIHDACDMLASGKKRVCCFDPSGFYSKAFAAPEAVE